MSRAGMIRKTADTAARTLDAPVNSQSSSPLLAPHSDSRDLRMDQSTALAGNTSDQGYQQDQDREREDREHTEARRLKLASIILFICIISFVLQTELTKFVQTSMGYQKPYFILYISHSFWAIALPLQFIYSTYLSPGAPGSHLTLQERISYFAKLVRHSTHDLYHRKSEYILVGQATVTDPTIPSSTPFSHAGQEAKSLWKYLFYVTFGMTILFMVPSYLWYSCVAMTSMANLTAIYNTACFFAYLFSVVLLNEKIVVNKVIAVILSLLGVAIISLTVEDTTVPDDQGKKHSTVALVGDFLALIGAALYGFEEVVYKKYASSKIQPVVFANTLTGLMGVVTCTMLWIPIPLLHWMGHEVFELPTLNEFSSILMIATLGLVYNGCFMIVVSQTSPVFAAVGVMATIPLVALTDWLLFNETIGWGDIVGGLSIIAGFAILMRENHKAL